MEHVMEPWAMAGDQFHHQLNPVNFVEVEVT
jgi:hypothetical protein